jgi:hypothetical protein
MSFAELLVPLLQTQFPQLDIVYDPVDKSIAGYQCENHYTCECFKLKQYPFQQNDIMVDHIKFNHGEDCKLSGTDIVSGIATVASKYIAKSKQYNEKHNADLPTGFALYDVSKLHVRIDGKMVGIPLATYYILLHGQSWYNKFGFVSKNYAEEQTANNTLRAKRLTSQFIKKVVAIVPEWASTVKAGMTQGELMKWIDTQLRVERKSEYYKVCDALCTYVKPHIQYDFYLSMV